MKHRLTQPAEDDVRDILTDTYRMFGEHQFARYVGILETGMAMIVEDPTRASSKDRQDIRAGVRSFHLQLAAKRKGGASHVVFYMPKPDEIVVLRVLSDSMNPRRRVISALKSEAGKLKQ